ATPVAGGDPVVFDFSTSSMSHGDLQLLRAEGREVPIGTGVDSTGADTTDPEAILDGGGIRPFGGHQGAMLSFMIETLAAGLTGGAFTFGDVAEAPEGDNTFRSGQPYILIDPEPGGTEAHLTRVRRLLAMLRVAGIDRLP